MSHAMRMLSSEPIIIDIETVPNMAYGDMLPVPTAPKNYKDPEKIAKHIAKKEETQVQGMALDIDFAKIKAIGFAIGLEAEPQTFIVGSTVEEDYEGTILQAVWGLIGHSHGHIIGYNLIGFDLPIMLRRAWVLGVGLEGGRRLEINRYSDEIIDLMLRLYHNGYGPGPKFRGLKNVYDYFVDENPLPELDGSQVAEMDDETLRLYLDNDIRMTQKLAKITKGWYW